jgi:hypothetical protein
MDYVTRQFINLTKKFRKELRKAISDLRTALQQQTKAIRKASKGDDEQQEPEQPPLIVRAELHIPENVEKNRKTHEDRQHRLQVWIVMGTWAAFLAASVYAYIAIRQWREMVAVRHQAQGAIDAANRSAIAAEHTAKTAQETFELARDQFRIEERAWIIAYGGIPPGVEAIVTEPSGDVILTIRVEGKNVGKTPAIDISQMPYELRISPSKTVNQEQASFSPHFMRDVPGATIPPSQGGQEAFVFPIKNSPNVIKKQDFEKVKTGELTAYFVGAIRYRDLFPPTIEPYETRYCVQYNPTGMPVGTCAAGKFSIK